MSQGIAALIQENKRRFYAGEIRNGFYKQPNHPGENGQSTHVIDETSTENNQASLWQNLKTVGQKIGEDLFYESV